MEAGATQNGRDPQIEEWLSDHGVTEYEYRAQLPLAEIDSSAGRRNQARLQALEEDRVVIMGVALEEGEELGPVVLLKRPRKRLLDPLDGNHRVAAMELVERRTTPAYVVTQELSDTQEAFLIRTANQRHGMPSTMDDRLQFAVHAIEKFGITHTEAARLAGIPAHKVHKRMSLIDGSRRFVGLLGNRRVSRLTQGALGRLHAIHSDSVAKEAAELATDAKMQYQDVNNLVTAINKARNENDQLRVVQSAREEIAARQSVTAAGKVEIPLPYKRAQRLSRGILNFDFDELRTTSGDAKLRRDTKAELIEASRVLAEEVAKL